MNRNWVVLVGILVVVVGAIAWSTVQPDAVVVVVRPVRETIRTYVEEQAVTELPHDYLVSMPISGWLEPIRLREGDRVEAGQVVAALEADDLRDRVSQAEQRIAVLEAQIAEVSDHRLEDNALIEAEATVKAIRETVQAAEAKIEASQAIAEFAEHDLGRLRKLGEAAQASDREMREAEMDFRRARAELQSDSLELAALKTLEAVAYIGPKFIRDYTDRKDFTLEQRRKELAEARTQLTIEQRNLARAQIRSPVSGVVLNRHQTRRQYLAAGTQLLTIGRLEEMEVIAEVLTERATEVRSDDPVEIFGHGLPSGSIAGRVARVYPAAFRKVSSLGVEQQRVNVAITMDQRPAALGTGFRAYVRIFLDTAEDALTVPRTCLFRADDSEWQVLTVREGRVVQQAVQVGLMNDDRAQVIAGLADDEEIVAHPSREITPGMRVFTQ